MLSRIGAIENLAYAMTLLIEHKPEEAMIVLGSTKYMMEQVRNHPLGFASAAWLITERKDNGNDK